MSKNESFTLDLVKLSEMERLSFADITGSEFNFINPQVPSYWTKTVDRIVFNWGDESVLMALALVLEHRQITNHWEKPTLPPTLYTLVGDHIWNLGQGEKTQDRTKNDNHIKVPFTPSVAIPKLENSRRPKLITGDLGIRYYYFQDQKSFIRDGSASL